MKKIAILGATGMLGSMLTDYFSRQSNYNIIATVRNEFDREIFQKKFPSITFSIAYADHVGYSFDFDQIFDCDYIINAIGITKPHIQEDNYDLIKRAVWINTLLSGKIAEIALKNKGTILQIATDCVYSGQRGEYSERDQHDALDVYGKTKSLGECYLPNVKNIRCSIIGPEIKGQKMLIEWFLRQLQNAVVQGYANHNWNGITTLHFAKICDGIIKNNIALPHLHHIIPADTISKADMLNSFAQYFNRKDIQIQRINAPLTIDRTLKTENKQLNQSIWKAAGYDKVPTIDDMIRELSSVTLKKIYA